MSDKPTTKSEVKKEETVAVSVPVVGEVLTAEAFEALKKQLTAEIVKDSSGAAFSIPGSADSADIGLHEQLLAGIPTDLRDKEVPAGAVAVYTAGDVRAVLPSGNTYVFVGGAIKHVPACDLKELKKFGVAEYVAKG